MIRILIILFTLPLIAVLVHDLIPLSSGTKFAEIEYSTVNVIWQKYHVESLKQIAQSLPETLHEPFKSFIKSIAATSAVLLMLGGWGLLWLFKPRQKKLSSLKQRRDKSHLKKLKEQGSADHFKDN